MSDNGKQTVLIVDDSEMNRSILADMLENEYNILEAENGLECIRMIQQNGLEISLILLDIVMPVMDGFQVLEAMNTNRWIDDIPVIVISAENGSSQIKKTYDLGVTDYIPRPFDELVVRKRVVNTLLAYAKQKQLMELAANEIYEKEMYSSLMFNIQSYVVEYRNGERPTHVPNVKSLTQKLLEKLCEVTDRYNLTPKDISLIAAASTLHDIGKVMIDSKILNKPGPLDPEEYTIVKTHTSLGYQMLQDLPVDQKHPLMKYSRQIARWHHERYDGSGYPDGLSGEDIPISAQAVALADVYDALTSERCYKDAIEPDYAMEMIESGQCGGFNPLLIQCLRDIRPSFDEEKTNMETPVVAADIDLRQKTFEQLYLTTATTSRRSLRLLDQERMKYSFFASMSKEIQFEYTESPAMITFSKWGAERLGIPEIIMNPKDSPVIASVFGNKVWDRASRELLETTADDPDITFTIEMNVGGEMRWYRLIARALWTNDIENQYIGCIGKIMDVHDRYLEDARLRQKAATDPLTGIANRARARELIDMDMENDPAGTYVLIICDVDDFKQINDTYGHLTGDSVLNALAGELEKSVRQGDVVARIGGDEFLLFLKMNTEPEPVIERIYNQVLSSKQPVPYTISMGAATTIQVREGYEKLFTAADQALYRRKKRDGKGGFTVYEPDRDYESGDLTPIDIENTKTPDPGVMNMEGEVV